MFKSEFLTMTSTTYSYFDSQLFFKSHLYILAHSFFFSLALPHPPHFLFLFFFSHQRHQGQGHTSWYVKHGSETGRGPLTFLRITHTPGRYGTKPPLIPTEAHQGISPSCFLKDEQSEAQIIKYSIPREA